MSFKLAQHDFTRTFYVFHYLCAADVVLGLPWFDDERKTLKFETERLFILMDGTIVAETQVVYRRLECLLMSSTKIQI
jgi:hypothetical protein